MLNISSSQGNATENHMRCHLTHTRMVIIKENQINKSCCEQRESLESSYAAKCTVHLPLWGSLAAAQMFHRVARNSSLLRRNENMCTQSQREKTVVC